MFGRYNINIDTIKDLKYAKTQSKLGRLLGITKGPL